MAGFKNNRTREVSYVKRFERLVSQMKSGCLKKNKCKKKTNKQKKKTKKTKTKDI